MELPGGKTAWARRPLPATTTGPADELPGPRGMRAPWGRSAFHCPYCHGYQCAGKHVAVTGADQRPSWCSGVVWGPSRP
ncbi:hypothetical protein [Nonomuraea sp. NPDC049625]|uniref:hypothetical protein n=1 Tax=Nonomuraea sp. NPDC049625 TaxID=3155775 RepID=UPI0034275054